MGERRKFPSESIEEQFVRNAEEYMDEHGDELGIKTEEDRNMVLSLARKAGIAEKRERKERKKEQKKNVADA